MIEAPSFSLYQLTIPIPWRGRGYFKIWSQIEKTNPRNDSNLYHYLPRMSSQYFLIFFSYNIVSEYTTQFLVRNMFVMQSIYTYIFVCVLIYILSLSSLSSFVIFCLWPSDKRFCFLLASFSVFGALNTETTLTSLSLALEPLVRKVVSTL